MKAKVFETVAGKGFSVKAGTILTDKNMDIYDDATYMERSMIQSLINQGVAAPIPDKPKE